MIKLSENASRAYELAKKIGCPLHTPRGLQYFVVGLPTDLRQRLSISGLDGRRVIAELERTELLKPVFGRKIVREIISTVKNSSVTRNQSVHEVVMLPDNEIEIMADTQDKKMEVKVPFSPLEIIRVAASNLTNQPQAKRIVKAAIGILEKNPPLLADEDFTQLITLRGKLEQLAIKESDLEAKIFLQAAIRFLTEFLKTKSPAASK